MKNNLKLDNGVSKIDKNIEVKKDLIELLLNGEGTFLEKVVNINLTKKQYDSFDMMVKKSYSKIGYKFKSFFAYEDNKLGNIVNKLYLDTFSFGDYLLYFAFKTKDEQFGYFYISLLDGANIINSEDLLFTNKQEFFSFIQKEIINKFLLNIDGLEEVKIAIGKNETLNPINNLSSFKKSLVA